MAYNLAIYRNAAGCDACRCRRGEIERERQRQVAPLQQFVLPLLPLGSVQLRCALHERDIRRPHHLHATEMRFFVLPGAAFKRRRGSDSESVAQA